MDLHLIINYNLKKWGKNLKYLSCQKNICLNLRIILDILTIVKTMVEKILITMDMSKLTCPKWHFGQVRHRVKKLNRWSF
jgi:hypothetical protein